MPPVSSFPPHGTQILTRPGIYGNCKDFPTHTRGVELLETGTGRWLNLLANETQEPLVAEILEVTDIQFHQ